MCEEENVEWLELRLAGRARVEGGVPAAGSGSLLACRAGLLWVKTSATQLLECDVASVVAAAAAARRRERAGEESTPPSVQGRQVKTTPDVDRLALAKTEAAAGGGGDVVVAPAADGTRLRDEKGRSLLGGGLSWDQHGVYEHQV